MSNTNVIYQVTYEFKGVEVVNVFLEDDVEIPADFKDWSLADQDAWLYENQTYAKKAFTDTNWGNAVNILPLAEWKSLKAQNV